MQTAKLDDAVPEVNSIQFGCLYLSHKLSD